MLFYKPIIRYIHFRDYFRVKISYKKPVFCREKDLVYLLDIYGVMKRKKGEIIYVKRFEFLVI